MKVELIEHMGDDLSVVNAARVSFKKWKGTLSDGDKSLIRYLARGVTEDGWHAMAEALAGMDNVEDIKQLMWSIKTQPTHFAPFCHPQAQFRVTTSLAVARQLWKSHIGAVGGDSGYAAWSEESRRYIKDDPKYDWPQEWRRQAVNVKQGSGEPFEEEEQRFLAAIGHTCGDRATQTYRLLVDKHLMAPEQARYILPTATETTWIWTGSLMFWARLAQLRLHEHAQAETREVVESLAGTCKFLWPVSWTALLEGR